MLSRQSSRPGEASWSADEIPFHALEREKLGDDTLLFYLLASASFIEITSDLYTRNLVEFYKDDAEIVDWLQHGWEPEELQHGVALKRYVETAWPDFDWNAAYRSFFADYSPLCSVELLAPMRALEMVARCVVETGTSSFYRMLAEASPEPVLTQLARNISSDEVRHYKHFYRYFMNYCRREQPGRVAVLRTLLKRTAEINTDDAFYAFKHVYLAHNPGAEFHKSDYAAYRDGVRRIAKRHFPVEMAVKMLLKPLGFSNTVGRVVLPMVTSTTQYFFRR